MKLSWWKILLHWIIALVSMYLGAILMTRLGDQILLKFVKDQIPEGGTLSDTVAGLLLRPVFFLIGILVPVIIHIYWIRTQVHKGKL